MSYTPTSADPLLADVVNDDLRAATVFERFELDYCCGGHQTLLEACAKRGVDPDAVRAALETLGPATEADKLPAEWQDLDQLTRYIVDHHHTYVTSSIPSINNSLNRIAEKHGERHPELLQLRATFRALGEELLVHLLKEENLLFPAIDEMARRQRGIENGAPMFATVLHPVRVMEDDHQEAGELIERVRTLTGGHYTPPDDACTTYTACFAELARFEQDLHRHIHLENNVLFPRALELERTVG